MKSLRCRFGIHRYRHKPELHRVPEIGLHGMYTGRMVDMWFHINYCTRCGKREFSRGL